MEKVLGIFDQALPGSGGRIRKNKLQDILSGLGVPARHIDALLEAHSKERPAEDGSISYRDFLHWIDGIAAGAARGAREILQNPLHANLTDGSSLIEHFRRIFDTLQGSSAHGVTPCRLEAALQSFAQTLPGIASHRISMIVAEIFDLVDITESGTITWPEFTHWLSSQSLGNGDSDEAVAELFDLCDKDGSGKISAQELMDMLLLLEGILEKKDHSLAALTPAQCGLLVRDLDSEDRGGIGIAQFTEVLHAARTSSQQTSGHAEPPHLVLNCDVNNTVMMLDTATGADASSLISMVLSNASWGVVENDADGKPSKWVLGHQELSDTRPRPGLKTYSEFVVLLHPFERKPPSLASTPREWLDQNEKVKARRRSMLWQFTNPGMPGESFRAKLEEMVRGLMLPEEVRGSEQALAAGLTGSSVQLLPSFLHMLRELKRMGRSFTLIFRTFGRDLPRIEQELRALCEGRHPLFLDAERVVLDGSDGKPDYRMRLDTATGCGTFFRAPEQDETISLVMGTTEQPANMEDGVNWFEKKGNVEIHRGPESAHACYTQLSARCGTIALRDHYQGWAAVGSTSRGGKPFFLNCLHDPSRHSIFFDDHISAADLKIVDPINTHHWPRRFGVAQIYGVHLVQAQPLHSIGRRDYFLDCIRGCEAARDAKLDRWRLLQRLVGDLAGVQQVLSLFVDSSSGGEPPAAIAATHVDYRPWTSSRAVLSRPHVDTFDDDG